MSWSRQTSSLIDCALHQLLSWPWTRPVHSGWNIGKVFSPFPAGTVPSTVQTTPLGASLTVMDRETDPPCLLHGPAHIGTESTLGGCLLGPADITKPRTIRNAPHPVARLRRETGRDGTVLLRPTWPTPGTASPISIGSYIEVVHNSTAYTFAWIYINAVLQW